MNIMALISALPGAAAQGLIWGIMAIGVYITFRTLDIADLTVDGTMCTGGAVCIMMMMNGHNVWVAMLAAFIAGMLAGLATGCNSNMARAQGINTNFNKVLGLMISNGLVALSSALLAQYQGFADINMGRGAIVIGLAAVIIGEAIFGRIFRNFALTLLSVGFGAVIYYLVLQVVIWLGVDTDLLKMFSAIVVAIFLAIPYWKSRYFAKPVRRGGSADA